MKMVWKAVRLYDSSNQCITIKIEEWIEESNLKTILITVQQFSQANLTRYSRNQEIHTLKKKEMYIYKTRRKFQKPAASEAYATYSRSCASASSV